LLVNTTENYLDTEKSLDFVDITAIIRKRVSESKVRTGIVTVYTTHTTCSIRINEYEDRLLADFELFLKKIAPRTVGYAHNRSTLDGRPNAHSHILSLLMNSSETIPIRDGVLCLGRWQRVFFIELDGPRSKRMFIVQVLGN